MAMNFKRRLPIPMEVKQMYPLTEAAAETKQKTDREVRDILTGKDGRKLLIIGPCSADDPDAVFSYCEKLKRAQERVEEKLLLIPRVYTNKPRTTGEGYKGLFNQPDPTAKPDPFNGILAARRLHVDILTQLGLSTADELLYPADHRYFSDLLSYVTVGARSTEDQEHRIVASGIPEAVGMKNPTGGYLTVMLNSIRAAQTAHEFLYRGWDVSTTGNDLAHGILRGYTNKRGEHRPNIGFDDLRLLCGLYKDAELKNPAFLVDVNHDNSGKDCFRQPENCFDVLRSAEKDAEIAALFKGFMIESYLYDGARKIGDGGKAGCSITDPCLGWEKTEKLICEIADIV